MEEETRKIRPPLPPLPLPTPHAQWTVVVTTRKSYEFGVRDHWSIVFEPELDVHQITGPKGYFYYIPRGGSGPKLFASADLLAKVAVGTFPSRDKWKVDDIFRAIPIVNESEEQEWDCQCWVVEALQALKAANYDVSTPQHAELEALLAEATRQNKANNKEALEEKA
jgi:hypothetical protein